MPNGTAANVKTPLGPGLLYVAALGTTETGLTASAAIPSAWQAIGYTDEGTEVGIEISTEDVEVAEEIDPLDSPVVGRVTTVAFAMAEATVGRLNLSIGGGIQTPFDSFLSYEPPDISALTGVMMLHKATSGALWLFRDCRPDGTTTVVARKAPDKRLIQANFKTVLPSTGSKIFKVWPNSLGMI
jgi:hypothetical protein